jgi:hypothetical protein
MRDQLVISISALIVLLILLVGYFYSTRQGTGPLPSISSSKSEATSKTFSANSGTRPSWRAIFTNVYAHNLLLRKGPNFRVYVRWLRGQIIPTRRNVNPSFDDPDSFLLNIKAGFVRANVGDICEFLNASLSAKSPLKNVTLSGDGNQIRLHATLRKLISLPIELIGTIAPAPGNRIQIHVTKLSLLKIPLKSILGGFHIGVSDLVPDGMPGIKVSGNNILVDPQKLLPPPNIRGQLTGVRIVNPDLEAVYGDAETTVKDVEQWRNFLKLSGGTLDFGKLTMRHVDLIMIDLSNDAWFDLDLAHYQEQLVNGYTRMTPQAGLQIFMPDLNKLPPQ